jgi:hypothetical protein
MRKTRQRKIIRLGTATGKDHILRTAPDQQAERLARILNKQPRPAAKPMH